MEELGLVSHRKDKHGCDPDLVNALFLAGIFWILGALLGFKSLLAGTVIMILGAALASLWLWEIECQETAKLPAS
jgi:hypothetical protein